MYDIPELEKKWRKYKRKKIQKPIIIGSIATVLLIGSGLLLSTYLNKSNKKVIVKTTQTAQSNINTKSNNGAIIIKKVNNTNSLVNVKATPQQANNAQNDNGIDISKAEIVEPNVPDDDIRVIGFNSKDKKKIKKKYEDILIPNQSKEDIQDREKIADIEDRFKSYQDPKDSLKLAKIYYKKGDYKKAESWAVSTNNIDGDIEESWLIFAKSRAKQGFRKDAIKVLQSYYDETNSVKAKELLKKIRFGKPF